MLVDQLTAAFPDLVKIREERVRKAVFDQWRYVGERNPEHTDIERIPVHPSLPIEKYGNLAAHIRGQTAISQVLVPTYKKEWGVDLDLDHFLACAVVHDSAKVIEFTYQDGALVAAPGFDHAYEAAKIALSVGFPREVAHMIAVHTYLGPKRLPRTAAAQIFQFLDPICVPVFPEQGKSAVERHLEANKWSAVPAPDDLP